MRTSSRRRRTCRRCAQRRAIASEKGESERWDLKHAAGGLVDLEFAVHTLQLTSHVGLDPRLEVALADLAKAGLVDDSVDPDLRLLSLPCSSGEEPSSMAIALLEEESSIADFDSLAAAGSMAGSGGVIVLAIYGAVLRPASEARSQTSYCSSSPGSSGSRVRKRNSER